MMTTIFHVTDVNRSMFNSAPLQLRPDRCAHADAVLRHIRGLRGRALGGDHR